MNTGGTDVSHSLLGCCPKYEHADKASTIGFEELQRHTS